MPCSIHLFRPVDCYINIVRFGSGFESLFPNSKKYTATTMAQATAYIDALGADLGGTALVAPLVHLLALPGITGYSRQMFVLTDGQVSDTQVLAVG